MNELGTAGLKLKHLSLLIFSLITIALLRNFLIVCLIPCLIAYLICKYTKIKPAYIYIAATILLFSFTLTITSINPNFSPWKWIVERQNEFFQLKKAGSQLTMHKLENNSKSIIENAPMAIDHGFFRPFAWNSPNPFSQILGIELYLYWVITGISLFWNGKMNKNEQTPIIGFAILLSILMITTIGYIVPNSSSIVRYRSLYLPFLLIPIWIRFSTKSKPS
jgi:membrane protein YdbS with pleckstrin-like domain